jgi:hypothetical protein
MGGTGIKKNSNGMTVDRKCTSHYRCPLGKLGECGEIHPPLTDLHHLPLAITLVVRIRCLPLERLPRLRAVLDEVGRASAIETTIVAVSWSSWQKTRPRTLSLLLYLWQRQSVELCLLGWSGYPSTRQIASRRSSRGITRNQPISWRLWSCRPCRCFPFLFCSVGGNTILLSNGHIDQLIKIVSLYQIQPFLKFGV